MIRIEDDLIKRARKGDPLAWQLLVKQHTQRIFNLCFRFVGRSNQAEDLTQEVFLRVFNRFSTHRPEHDSFVIWVVGITRNLLVDHYRATRDDQLTASTDTVKYVKRETSELSPFLQSSQEGKMTSKECAVKLHMALQELSPELREAFILGDLEELSYEEIAAILNVPAGTVKSRINRGRLELAKSLRRNPLQEQGTPV